MRSSRLVCGAAGKGTSLAKAALNGINDPAGDPVKLYNPLCVCQEHQGAQLPARCQRSFAKET